MMKVYYDTSATKKEPTEQKTRTDLNKWNVFFRNPVWEQKKTKQHENH